MKKRPQPFKKMICYQPQFVNGEWYYLVQWTGADERAESFGPFYNRQAAQSHREWIVKYGSDIAGC